MRKHRRNPNGRKIPYTAQPERNLAMYHMVLSGASLTTVGRRYGVSGMRVKQIVDLLLGDRGFARSRVPGRHDLEIARSIYRRGGLR